MPTRNCCGSAFSLVVGLSRGLFLCEPVCCLATKVNKMDAVKARRGVADRLQLSRMRAVHKSRFRYPDRYHPNFV